MIEGDALTAWLILKAPLLAAFIYSFQAIKGDQQGIITTVFFFPYVFLLFRNLWLEVLHEELLSKLKFAMPAGRQDSGLEIEQIRKLFKITRLTIAALAVAEMFLIPLVMNAPSKPGISDIPVMMLIAVAILFTGAIFILQIRFANHIGKLMHVLETKRKFDPLKEFNISHSLKILNPVAFSKCHYKIKIILKKV